MEFSPANHIVQLCLQGMAMEDRDSPEEALTWFLRAWEEASCDFEKFLAAYYIARHQHHTSDTLLWLETALKAALSAADASVRSALPGLYSKIAGCYEDLNDTENAEKYRILAGSSQGETEDRGPFYHGTKADLKTGDRLTPGGLSNYKADLRMNHIYFTALVNGAGLAAAMAKGEGNERVYIVEPEGSFENDPNVTDKKFPGNPTRSYRSASPLKIIGEVTDWNRQTDKEIRKWKEKLANNRGEIIN
ncbi:rifampin ADP-ribosylating transferase [Sinomicrobium oceani]|uniref:Rifampin ADP-ribosylating transferase n=1 Tax=Sinomicrobium oceani TaxID=1150368 RepID=A0A1K1Q4D3_9FLAO|nr:NAD(+)--rifampin ADP-ribosyltransferase [Sinomicrobium oceani]SFW54882.1 rifampin ADP-ribosylating transferase [Sinomicrobium oceani]